MKHKSISLLVVLSSFFGCASRQQVDSQYQDLFSSQNQKTSGQTVIVFLVDGLPLDTFKSELSKGNLPRLNAFFVQPKNQFYVARTGFPSLTYPGISSLLTEKTVDGHGVTGNIEILNGEKVNFESPNDLNQLNSLISGRNIFSRLRAKGKRTASFDYAFNSDSTVHTDQADIEAGLSIVSKDYTYVDQKLLESLQLLLENNPASQWPDFIFVHLIGVDLTTHDHGPNSAETLDYLRHLDAQLNDTFQLLQNAEKSGTRKIIAMLTSDHGFDSPVTKTLNLEESLENVDRNIVLLNEGRFGGINFPTDWDSNRRIQFQNSYAANKDIDFVATRLGNTIFIQSDRQNINVTLGGPSCGGGDSALYVSGTGFGDSGWLCPAQFEIFSKNIFYPYFTSNLTHYFQAPNRPDAVIVPKPGVAFVTKYKGQHGGPTPQEIFVPLLMHGASATDQSKIPGLWELLNFL